MLHNYADVVCFKINSNTMATPIPRMKHENKNADNLNYNLIYVAADANTAQIFPSWLQVIMTQIHVHVYKH